MKNLQIFIITGLSGSGKSTSLDAFEDAGFYCVDNMPVALLPKFLELPLQSRPDIEGFAFVMDLRESHFLQKYRSIFNNLRKKGRRLNILFLEADETMLVQRYSQTRRHHPLSQDKGVVDGIREETKQLAQVREIADKIINTTEYNVYRLKSVIHEIARKGKKTDSMLITVMSFGFKYGIPTDVDQIMDVRFLPNPFFVAELKDLDGESDLVKQFVLQKEETIHFVEKYTTLLDNLIPLYKKEGKSYLTIAIGCTGGHHRSVSIARSLYDHIRKREENVNLKHRDIHLE